MTAQTDDEALNVSSPADDSAAVGATATTVEAESPAVTLGDVLKEATGPLNAEAFRNIAAAVFQDSEGTSLLKHHLGEWDALSFPDTSQANIVKGYAHFLLGNLQEAEDVLAGEKKTPWGAYYYARTLLARHRKEDAFNALEAACENNPDHVEVKFLLSEVCCKTGREEEAGKLLEKLETEVGNTSEFQYYKGFWFERTSEYQQAIESYRQAVALDAGNANACFRLGFCLDLYGKGDDEAIDEAIIAYEHCLKVFPPHTNAVINLGILYEDRERYHDAIKCFESVLAYNPSHQRARLFLEDVRASTKMFYDKEEEKKADRHSQVLKIPVTDFELSVRSRNCLAKMNISTLGDLIMKTEQELLAYKNFGETSLKEIKEMLAQKGLRLGQGLEKPGASVDEPRNPLEATASQESLDRPIDTLDLSVRSRRCMERLGIQTIRDLINRTEVQLMAAKNFGMTSLNEIKRKLSEMNLKLRGS